MTKIENTVIFKNASLFLIIRLYVLLFTLFVISILNLTGIIPFVPLFYLLVALEVISNFSLSSSLSNTEIFKKYLFSQFIIDYVLISVALYLFIRIAPWLSLLVFSFFILLAGLFLKPVATRFIAAVSLLNIVLIQMLDSSNRSFYFLTPFGEWIEHTNIYYLLYLSSGAFIFLLTSYTINILLGSQPLSVKQIRKEKEQLRSTLESLGDGVIVTDERGMVILANKGAEELFETSKKQLLNKGLFVDATIFKHTFDFAEGDPRNWLMEVLNEGKPKEGMFKIIFPLEEKSIKITITPVTGEKEKQIGAVVVFDDLTKVERLETVKSDFISTLSHELRTPLTSIKGYVSLLLHPKASFDNTARKDYLTTIDRQTNHLIRLIDDLLDASKIESGRLELKKEYIKIKPLVEKVVVNLKPNTKKHRFELIFPKEVPDVFADSDRIDQILTNLISNAIKYSPDGGRITIRGIVDNGHLEISVEDEGIGVQEEHLPSLFEQFFRVDTSLSRETGGTGLGLYIAKSLTELHQGKIWCESREGEGSEFHFSIPITG